MPFHFITFTSRSYTIFLVINSADNKIPELRAFCYKKDAIKCFNDWSIAYVNHHSDLVQMFHINDDAVMTKIGKAEYIENDETPVDPHRVMHFYTGDLNNMLNHDPNDTHTIPAVSHHWSHTY